MSKKIKYRKGKEEPKISSVGMILIAGMSALLIGFIFMIIYYIGEQTGFAGVITLTDTEFGETIMVFITVLLGSIFLGSFLVLLIVRNNINRL